jgi:hypothetical protein
MEDNQQMKLSHIQVEDASQSYAGFKRPEMDAIRRVGAADNNIDESTSSMALTEIKQTPLQKKATELETSMSIQNSEGKGGRRRTKGDRDPKDSPLVINAMYTQYEVLKDVGDEINFALSYDEEEDWDIYWIDGPVAPTFLLKMQMYQRTNHFPGMYALARKNLLAKNLMSMKKVCSSDFNFFPKTWLLP